MTVHTLAGLVALIALGVAVFAFALVMVIALIASGKRITTGATVTLAQAIFAVSLVALAVAILGGLVWAVVGAWVA